MKINLIISMIALSLGLTACGGSGESKNTEVDNTIYPVSHNLDGVWSICTYDNTTGISEQNYIYINGSSFTRYVYFYQTLDCSGTLTDTVKLTASVEYRGQQATSTCMAEKTNSTYTELLINGVEQTTQQLSTFLQLAKVPNPAHDISCIYSNKLFTGMLTSTQDGATESRRPTTLDLSKGADPI